jgi:hypothetical protein
MIASDFSATDLPLVVIVSGQPERFVEMQRRLKAKCLFFVCNDEQAALRIARHELVSGWIVDATAPRANFFIDQLAETHSGQRVALVEPEYCAGSEIRAYQSGTYYVCGELVADWLENFLYIDSVCTASVDAESVNRQQAEMAISGGHS